MPMGRVAASLLSVVWLAGALALPRPALAQTGRVTGLVVDEARRPVQGATVVAVNERATPYLFSTTTDRGGRFAMTGLQSGPWSFMVSAKGYWASLGSAKVVNVRGDTRVELALTKVIDPSETPGWQRIDVVFLQTALQNADTLMRSGHHDQALAAYEAILAHAPFLTLVNLQIGNARLQKRDYDGALAAYDIVLKADATNELAIVLTAGARAEKGDRAGAEAMLEEAAARPGAGREVSFALGDLRAAAGESEAAVACYEKAAGAGLTWAKPVLRLGLLALERKDQARATALLERVVELAPDSPEAAEARAALARMVK